MARRVGSADPGPARGLVRALRGRHGWRLAPRRWRDDPGRYKAIAHAGSRVSGPVPRPRRRHDDRARALVRTRPGCPTWPRSGGGRPSARSGRPTRWSRRSPGPRSRPAAPRRSTASTSSTTSRRPTGRSARTTPAGSACPTLWQVLERRGARGRQPEPADDLPAAPGPRPGRRRLRRARASTGPSPSAPSSAARSSRQRPRLHAQDRLEEPAPRPLDELRSQAARNRAIFRGPGRGRRAGRRPDRLVGPDGPLPQPRQPPAPALALPRRRRDGRPRAGLERRGRVAACGARRERRPADGAGLEARRGGHRGLRPRLRPVQGAGQRQRPAPPRRASSAA